MCGRAVNTLNSRSGGLGFKPDVLMLMLIAKETGISSSRLDLWLDSFFTFAWDDNDNPKLILGYRMIP